MKKFRIGVLGANRGLNIAENFRLLGCEIVALCEIDEKRARKGLEIYGEDLPVYKDFDEFLQLDLDAVIIANFFHEHTPFAIKCFEKNIHVFCECISNSTLAEGVELLRAYEKSDSIYMLAENYPNMIFNREMKRVCDGGTLGKILYAEGEYNHPLGNDYIDFFKWFCYYPEHWRNLLPRSYYITHSLAPIMWSTGASPVRVSATPVFEPFTEEATGRLVGDRAAIITTLNDDNSVFKLTGCASFGAHSNSYRICGVNGQIENLRGMGDKVMLRYNNWCIPDGLEENNLYDPKWNDPDEEFIKQSGHGGGDYLIARAFLDCISEKKEPDFPFDIYSAVKMSAVAILAHRSILNDGKSYYIPDYRDEKTRKELLKDTDSPFYYSDGREPTIPCCSVPDYTPTEEQIKKYIELMSE